jgi:hypothetical protein
MKPQPSPIKHSCYFKGETVGELDCGCSDAREYFQCHHPGVVYAVLRRVHHRPGNPMVQACTTCPYYFPAFQEKVKPWLEGRLDELPQRDDQLVVRTDESQDQ